MIYSCLCKFKDKWSFAYHANYTNRKHLKKEIRQMKNLYQTIVDHIFKAFPEVFYL